VEGVAAAEVANGVKAGWLPVAAVEDFIGDAAARVVRGVHVCAFVQKGLGFRVSDLGFRI
jgi:hypothetical protein